jgi:hypothetical protein
MRNRWSALVVVLALVLMPRAGFAQSGATQQKAPAVTLKQNTPNPFNPDTRGAFIIGDPPTCSDGGKLHRVSIKIYNVLSQLVSVPKLQGGSGGVAGGSALDNVLLPCGQYGWYWDGNFRNTLKEAASGVYFVAVTLDGRTGALLRILRDK